MHAYDPEDIVDVSGLHVPRPPSSAREDGRTPWKMIWFKCCHVYGRIYRNAERTRYAGQCPKCGGCVQAHIGHGGTNRSIFHAE